VPGQRLGAPTEWAAPLDEPLPAPPVRDAFCAFMNKPGYDGLPDESNTHVTSGTGRSPMKIHRLYADKKGESHFEDVEVEFTEAGRGGRLSPRLPATGIIFREVPSDYDLDWHPAPRRQYIINLDAGVQITASDGEVRRIGAGEVLLVEDTWGKGHLSKALDARVRHCIFVPVD
jgi:hypothetical protein